MLVVADLVRFRRRVRSALVTWRSPRPPFYRLSLGIGVALGVLLAVRMVVQGLAPWDRRRPGDTAWSPCDPGVKCPACLAPW